MTLLTIVLMGVVTFALRAAFFGPLAPERLSWRVQQALTQLQPAVLMALIAPGVLLAPGVTGSATPWLSPYVVGAVAGFTVGLIRRDSFLLVFLSATAAFAVTGLLQ